MNDIETKDIKQELVAFEKRHGNKNEIEEVILNNRRQHYEKIVESDGFNYDVWFDYIRLEENEGDITKIREVYELAVQNIPPILEKKYWKRYIYLWINYFIFEELQAKDIEQARKIYRTCLHSVLPNKGFTFGKIWLMAANFEVRQKELSAARKILGQGIGMWGKENIFKGYIALESQLGEIDRCRQIYTKYLEVMPHNCLAWKAFAQLESDVDEVARARACYFATCTRYA